MKSIQHKNKHKGKRCFILGNGPSLGKVDLTKLEKEITFGSNRIYLMYKHGLPQVSYQLIADATWWKNHGKEIVKYPPKQLYVRENVVRRCNLVESQYDGVFATGPKITKIPKNGSFCFDTYSYQGGTVSIDCIQLAHFLGFKKIYLIGMDCTYEKGRHAYDEPDEGFRQMKFNDVFFGYSVIKRVFTKEKIEIYNAGPGGKLEEFKRIDFNTLF